MQYNMSTITIFLISFALYSTYSYSYERNTPETLLEQEVEKEKDWIVPYGFLRVDCFFDSRQVIATLEQDDELFFPAPACFDKCGQDINAQPQSHITPIATRLGCNLHALNWHDPKLYGRIEGDFRGTGYCREGGRFRVRHAYGRISSAHWQFLFGQYWHPLFIVECTPRTVSYNEGAPFDVYSRNPQLRITYLKNNYEIIAAAAAHSFDFKSAGPKGATVDYQQRAIVPNMHLQYRYYGQNYLIGAAGDYKRLIPRLATQKCYKETSSVNSFIGTIFGSLYNSYNLIQMKGIYAQNGADISLISGYAVKTRNETTDQRTYTPTAAWSLWIDYTHLWQSQNQELGFYTGITKNLGARSSLYICPKTDEPIIYALEEEAAKIDYAVRFSPRYTFAKDPFRLGLEIEYTRASFGEITHTGKVINAIPVNNIRLLSVLYYVF